MSRPTRIAVLLLSVLVLSYVGWGFLLGQTKERRAYRPLGVFAEVLQHVQQDYVEEPDLKVVTSSALRGMLEAMDPHSSYLSPAEYTEYKKRSQNGAKGGVGAVLSKRFGFVVVVSVLPESPAERVGLRYGDLVESIEGFTTREMSLEQAYLLLAGAPGTGVKVSVVRRAGTDSQEVQMVRAAPATPPLYLERLPGAEPGRVEGEIAYVRVPSFDSGRAEELRAKLAELDRAGVRKLVLDLRSSASGDAKEAVAAARLFLSAGAIGSLRGQTQTTQEFAAEPAKVAWKHPVAVLIGNGSAGPAEVLAAAIAETGRGKTVGARTFGSASEQKLIPLEDGAALILTVAKYYTPGGTSIPDEGVSPAVEAESPADDSELGAPAPRRIPPDPAKDQALRKAIELLRSDGEQKSACLRKPAELTAKPAKSNGRYALAS